MKQREQFGSRLGFVLVSAGCAVGLGNVWKFPYVCGQYGGAAFILIYLIFLALLGAPIIVCEIAVGRGSGKGIAKAYNELEPEGEKWHLLKWTGIAGNYLLMMFYAMVCGWMFNYAYKMLTGKMSGMDSSMVAGKFQEMLSSSGELLIWTLVAILVAFSVCALGLEGGIEKITKGMMVILIVLMIVLAGHSLLLDNAMEGVKFYLVPDFNTVLEKGIGEVIFAAMMQAFFTLSVGIGSMEIFGSYMSKKRAITGESVSIIGVDTFVALMAGFIIIPACFAYNVELDSGPSLLFITLPNVFNNMAGGRIWGCAFFIFMSFAALSTVIAVFENILSFFMDGMGWSRKKAVLVNIVAISILSLPAVLGYNVWSGIHPVGSQSTIMDLEDFLVSYNLLPLGSLLFVLFCTKKNGWGFENFLAEVNTGEGMKFPKKIRFYMTYILPWIIVVIYLKGYYDMFSPMGTKVLIGWMIFAAILLAGIYLISFGILNKKKKKNK